MSGIITAAEYKSWRGLSGTAFDSQIDTLRVIADDLIQELAGCKFDAGTYTEIHDGDGTQELITDYVAISSITSIKIGNATQTTLTATTYGHDGDRKVFRLPRDDGQRYGVDDLGLPVNPMGNPYPVFDLGYQNVELVYTAGYATASMPWALKRAAFMMVDSMFDTRGNDQLFTQTKTDSGVSSAMRTVAESNAAITAAIRPYRMAQ